MHSPACYVINSNSNENTRLQFRNINLDIFDGPYPEIPSRANLAMARYNSQKLTLIELLQQRK